MEARVSVRTVRRVQMRTGVVTRERGYFLFKTYGTTTGIYLRMSLLSSKLGEKGTSYVAPLLNRLFRARSATSVHSITTDLVQSMSDCRALYKSQRRSPYREQWNPVH